MNLFSGTRVLDAFAEPPEHFLTAHTLAGVQRFNRLQQLGFEFGQRGGHAHEPHVALFLETAQTGADDFAGGLVKAGADLLLNKFFKFWRQRNIHN
jgi:hypothetical protein